MIDTKKLTAGSRIMRPRDGQRGTVTRADMLRIGVSLDDGGFIDTVPGVIANEWELEAAAPASPKAADDEYAAVRRKAEADGWRWIEPEDSEGVAREMLR